jgi:hypothetical protein
MAKLTLSVDDTVISQAKDYARKHGVSLSELVQTYLSAVSRPQTRLKEGPALKRLRGILKGGDRADYRKHLLEKYL